MTKNSDETIEDARLALYCYSPGQPINARTCISLIPDASDDYKIKLMKFDKMNLSFSAVKDFGAAY